MTRVLAILMLLACMPMVWTAAPPDRATWERFGKIEGINELNLRGVKMYRQGKYADATRVFAELLRRLESQYPTTRYPQGHPNLGASINNLAFLHQVQGEYAKAQPLYERALKMT